MNNLHQTKNIEIGEIIHVYCLLPHRCNWTFRAPEGSIIRLQMQKIQLPESTTIDEIDYCLDYLTISDPTANKELTR